MEKLKRGEEIGPMTKAAMGDTQETKDEDDENTKEAKSLAESAKADEVSKDGPPGADATVISEASEEPTQAEPDTPAKFDDGESPSDTTSNVSDSPPTPPLNDAEDPDIVDSQDVDLVEENILEAKQLREHSRPDLSPETLADALSRPTEDTTASKSESKDTPPTIDENETKTEEKVGIIVPPKPKTDSPEKELLGWEMLEMVIKWIKNEFSADEEALARQLANGEISYRFLWLYYTPGTLVSVKDSVTKQQLGVRVVMSSYKAD